VLEPISTKSVDVSGKDKGQWCCFVSVMPSSASIWLVWCQIRHLRGTASGL